MKEPSRRFLPLGRLHERTTKTGTPYLAGTIAEQPVFLFAQGDGTWKAYVQVEEERAPTPEAPVLLDEERVYERTLAGVEAPDYDEPMRPRSVREDPARRRAARRSARTESE